MRMQFNMTDTVIRRNKAWWVLETPHYLLMFDDVAREMVTPERFGAQAERRLATIASLLHLARDKKTRRYPLGRRVCYFVHDPAVCKYGNVDIGGIDVPAGKPWTFYQHEETHAVLAALVDSVPSLFNEGFATFAQSPTSRQNDRIALAGIDHGALANLISIIEFRSFWKTWNIRGGFMYQQAGSFIAYLIRRHGADKFLRLCRSCSQEDSQELILDAFRAVYGKDLPAVEKLWKAFLFRERGSLRLISSPKVGGSTERHWVQRTLNHIAKETGGQTTAVRAFKGSIS